MKCATHPAREAVGKCAKCGKALCKSCYEDFDLDEDGKHIHLCSECYKEECRREAAEVKALKRMVIREFIFIIAGLIIGLVLGLDILLGFGLMSSSPSNMIIAPIYLPFIFGSLLTIVKKIKYQFSNKRDSSGENSGGFNFLMLAIIIILNILIAPITTIIRFCQRINDMRKLNRIYRADTRLITTIDEYIANSLRPSPVAVAAGEALAADAVPDVEILTDSVLAQFGGSDDALCDNGEILRNVRYR